VKFDLSDHTTLQEKYQSKDDKFSKKDRLKNSLSESKTDVKRPRIAGLSLTAKQARFKKTTFRRPKMQGKIR
jgi:hypothetical protein